MRKRLFYLIFLIIGAIFGSGITYFIINKDYISFNNNEQENNSNSNEQENNSNSNEQENNSNSNEQEDEISNPISLIEFYPDSLSLLVDGKVYVNVYGSTTDIDNLYGANTFQTLLTTRNNYQEYSFEGLNYKDELNSTFTGMKLNISNIKEVYSFANGQTLANNYGLILLNEDGNVYIISLYSLIMGKKDVTKVESLNNIVSINSENNNGYYTYATDNLGVLYNMNDYIPKDYTLW